FLRVRGGERTRAIDERGHAAHLLRFRNHLQRKRRLARRLRPEDLDDTATRDPADAQRVVDADGSGGNGFDRLDGAFLTQAHDRAFAELLFDLAESNVDCFLALAILTFVSFDWHVGESSGSTAILDTCRAKVKRSIVNQTPKQPVTQHLTKTMTFAPRART